MERQAYITGQQLEPLLQEAERAGLQVGDVLERLGHVRSAEDQNLSEMRVSLVDYFRLEGEVARRLDDLTAHLSERKLTFATGAFVTTQINRSTTLSEALTILAQYFNMMHGEHYNTVRTTDRTVSLIIDDKNFPYTMKDDPDGVHFVGDCVLIKVQCLLDSLSDGHAAHALRRVSVKRPQTDNAPAHLKFWNAPISYGHANYEVCFDHELARASMRASSEVDLSSEGVFSRVIAYLEQAAPSDKAVSYSARCLDLIRNGTTQQDLVAHRLSISVATLRRRLEEEGTNFRDLISAHLLEQAKTLLQKGYSVAHVSEVLNYSDVRAFNRAFKRWKGETPAKYAQRKDKQLENS